MTDKKIVEPDRGLRLFPAFPVVLACVESEGKRNIITLGMVHVFSFEPPLVGVGVHPKRYSFAMMRNAKEFTLNIPGKDLLEKTNFCGTHSGRDTDKFRETGLTPGTSETVKSPVIEECPVNYECKVVKELETGDHVWFIAEVTRVRVSDNYDKENALIYWGKEYRTAGKVLMVRK